MIGPVTFIILKCYFPIVIADRYILTCIECPSFICCDII
ncbi:hypothetical protein CP10743SC13_0420 [Chlamydia psittaci 10_743_SC13]|nr:hypothetical protein CP10743SC13_0420 [Chlamydia psittaci 10_743_SC13]